MNPSEAKHRERTIGQRRFWEPPIRDPHDFNRPVDDVHWNPVKHGHVTRVGDWPYSTFHRSVATGTYPADGGGGDAATATETDCGESG
jgi:putative transposase